MFELICCCFGSSSIEASESTTSPTSEKSHLLTHVGAYTAEKSPSYRPAKIEVAGDIVETIFSASINSIHAPLQDKLEDIVHETGWWHKAVAEAVLAALKHAIRSGKKMNHVMQQAYDKAAAEAKKIEELKTDHPVLMAAFLTIVALGVLYLVWPAIIAALGFGEEGIVLGSFAARWQSLYPDVPFGSVFAFLQRLGMTLK